MRRRLLSIAAGQGDLGPSLGKSKFPEPPMGAGSRNRRLGGIAQELVSLTSGFTSPSKAQQEVDVGAYDRERPGDR
jgi:hypothetical protein